MTEKTLDWLNQNRHRAYPFVNDDGLVYNKKRIPDCVLLDCIVVDTRNHDKIPELVFTKIQVESNRTVVMFSYAGSDYSYTLLPSNTDTSDTTITTVDGRLVSNLDNELLYIKLVFSSHNYILNEAGAGTWLFHGKVLPTKIISVESSGVSGIRVNGSSNVDGFDAQGTATGEVHLVDGYRTQPVIQDGNVVVKVGTMYGEDPCHYSNGLDQEDAGTQCDDLLLFFCGQTGSTSGNVVIEGGPGVTVKQGSLYKAKEDISDTYGNVGIQEGEEVPCIEIIASTDLLNIYRPTVQVDSSSSSSDSSSSPEYEE